MTTKEPMPELKPCPFCGGEAKMYSEIFPDEENYAAVCDGECAVKPYDYFYTELDAIAAWNTRAPDKIAIDRGAGPQRYWLIEQTDLEEDDDYRIIHTTDLDVYPDAKILGEYVRADTTADKAEGGGLIADTDKGMLSEYFGGSGPMKPHPPAVAGDVEKDLRAVYALLGCEAVERKYLNEAFAAMKRIEAALTQPDADLMAVRDAVDNIERQIRFSSLTRAGDPEQSDAMKMEAVWAGKLQKIQAILDRKMKGA